MSKLKLSLILIAATCLATTVSFGQSLAGIISSAGLSPVAVLSPADYKSQALLLGVQKMQESLQQSQNQLVQELGPGSLPGSAPTPMKQNISGIIQDVTQGSKTQPVSTTLSPPPPPPPAPAAPAGGFVGTGGSSTGGTSSSGGWVGNTQGGTSTTGGTQSSGGWVGK